MVTQVDPKVIQTLKQLWPILKPFFVKAAISFSTIAAATQLIPDTAVMSSEELKADKPLTPKELTLRKAVIPILISSGMQVPQTIVQIIQMLNNPGIQSKLLALARTLSATPSFLLAYQLIKRKIEDQEPTLNYKEIFKDSPVELKTALKMHGLGAIASGAVIGGAAMDNCLAPKLITQ